MNLSPKVLTDTDQSVGQDLDMATEKARNTVRGISEMRSSRIAPTRAVLTSIVFGVLLAMSFSGCASLKYWPTPSSHAVPDGMGGYWIYQLDDEGDE